MLDQLRQGARGWVSKVLMGLLVLSFAVWGIGGFEGYGAGTLAQVGDQEVSVPAFARANERAQQNAQQSGQQVRPDQVLQQLLLNAALDDEASDFNLGVSDAHIAKQIAEQEVFQGANGAFDRERFLALLQNAGINRDDYVGEIRRETVREQIETSVAAGVEVPQPMIEALYRFQNEERSISFIVLDESIIDPVGAPDDAALTAYFDANKERFKAPEYRKLALLTLDPAALAAPDKVTEEEIAAEYERRKEGFTRPERRRIEQIRFADKAAAEAAQKKIEGGADFATVATESGMAPEHLDLGLKTRAEVLDAAIAEAAFAAEANKVVPVIEKALEPSLIRVTEIEPGSVTPLAEVSDRLRKELATRGAREKVQDMHDEVEDERAGGSTLQEISQKVSLPYREVAGVARDGTAPDETAITDLPAKEQLLEEAFESDVGVENNPVRVGGDTYTFYDVMEIVPERERTLDEVKDKVVAAWQSDETQNRVAEKADALLGRLQKGEAIATLAAEVGKPVQTVENVKRGAPAAGLSANSAAQAFAGPEGHVANADGDAPPQRVLLKVDKVTAPAFFAQAAGVDGLKEQLAEALRGDLMSSYNRQLLNVRDTSINQAAFAQLTGTVTNSNQAQ